MSTTCEEQLRKSSLRRIAEEMLVAARTAPKARGIDNLVLAVADREGIKEISDKLNQMAQENEAYAFLGRDAKNILSADQMVLMGTPIKSLGLEPCTLCGFAGCEEKDRHPTVPCVFNVGDLGIAVGSAASVAMEHRVDNRIMYSVGRAVLEMKMLGEEVKIAFGIPLSASGKNPFFDRK